jgi:hypothetical protein
MIPKDARLLARVNLGFFVFFWPVRHVLILCALWVVAMMYVAFHHEYGWELEAGVEAEVGIACLEEALFLDLVVLVIRAFHLFVWYVAEVVMVMVMENLSSRLFLQSSGQVAIFGDCGGSSTLEVK